MWYSSMPQTQISDLVYYAGHKLSGVAALPHVVVQSNISPWIQFDSTIKRRRRASQMLLKLEQIFCECYCQTFFKSTVIVRVPRVGVMSVDQQTFQTSVLIDEYVGYTNIVGS